MKKLTSFTLGETYYFTIYEVRGFIDLHTVVDFLEDVNRAVFDYRYDNKKGNKIKSIDNTELTAIIEKVKEKSPTLYFGIAHTKYKDAEITRDKLCDGGTEGTFKVQLYNLDYYPSGDCDYIIFMTNMSVKEELRERIMLRISPMVFHYFFKPSYDLSKEK